MSNKENYQEVGRFMVSDQKGFRIIRKYYSGWHPELGTLINGWSGKETEVTYDVIKPVGIVEVKDEQGS
jgi:hypothetical protein